MLPRVAALGYYGFGNLGDEAVLAGIRAALQTIIGDTDFLVLSANSDATTALHKGVRAADRWKLRDLPAVLKNTDLFVLGGGSLLQDATSAKSVLWYAVAAHIARRKSKRVLWWAQGVGPLKGAVSRLAVRFIANQADAITVRDTNSRELLKVVGARGSIETVADAAFALVAPIPKKDPLPYALVALRQWRDDALLRAVDGATLGQHLSLRMAGHGEASRRVRAFAMHAPDDAEFAQRYFGSNLSRFEANNFHALVVLHDWATKSGKEQSGDFQEILQMWADARIVMAMRLHALIFAAICGTPFVALSYDPKVDALSRASGQEDALLAMNDITETRLLRLVDSVLATSEARRARLLAFAQEQRRLAMRPAGIAAGWL